MLQFEEFNDSIANEFGYNSIPDASIFDVNYLHFAPLIVILLYIIILILVIVLLIVLIRKLRK